MKKTAFYLSIALNGFFIVLIGMFVYEQNMDPIVEDFSKVFSVRWRSVDNEVAAVEKSLSAPVTVGQRKLLRQLIAGRHVGVVLPDGALAKIYKKDPYYKYNQ